MRVLSLLLCSSSIVSAQLVVTISEYRCSTSVSSSATGSSGSDAPAPSSGGSETSVPSGLPTGAVLPPLVGSTPPPGLGGTAPPGSAADTVDELFWVNYAETIRQLAKVKVDDTRAFFIGSDSQMGPLAGSSIPDEYTNQGIYQIGNHLLNSSTMFYTPDNHHGYAEAISNYLDNVDLEGKPTPTQAEAELEAMKDVDEALAAQNYQLGLANETYYKELAFGLNHGQNFSTWLNDMKFPRNAPGYVTAVANSVLANNHLTAIRIEINGAKSIPWAADKARVAKAFDEDTENTGYNMHAAFGDVLSVAELRRLQSVGQPAPVPSSVRVPLYSAARYRGFIIDAQTKAGGEYVPENSQAFTVDTGKDTTDYNFGQNSVGAHYGGGWFYSFGASGEASTEKSSLQTSSATTSVSVNVTYDAIEVIDITPGLWNIDVSQYKIKRSAPANLRELVQPTQLVVANRLGYEITVSAEMAESLDTHYKEVVAASGGFRIFGISIWGGSAGHTDERNTHEASFDKASRTFKVVPRDDTGVATLIGVVGSKFNILVTG